MARTSVLPLLCLFLVVPPAFARDDKQARQAVERGLTFLETEGLAWLKNRKCIACHHAAFMIWSHQEARRHGVAVDAKKLDEWTALSLDLYLATRQDHQAKKNGAVEATHLMLGIGADAKAAGRLKDVSALLHNAQKPEGCWKYEGQLIKRPDAESDEATTLWAVLALPEDAAGLKAREQALAWLKKQPTGAGNEAAVARLLAAARLRDAEEVKARGKELLARQNADGGWSWMKGVPSDAFATGQSLYALAAAGLSSHEPAVRRGVQFLLAKQRPDGSWFSPTRKPNAKDNPIAVYWGSAWATIGLAQTLLAAPAADDRPRTTP